MRSLRKKSEDEKGDDSNILGYSQDHSRWFYAASYDGDCSPYKVLLQRINSTTLSSPLCLRVLLLHSNARCVLFTATLTCCTPGVRSWSHTYLQRRIHYDEKWIRNYCNRYTNNIKGRHIYCCNNETKYSNWLDPS